MFCVPTTVLRSGRAEEEEEEEESMASEGWLATANCICTISDKVPFVCVMLLGGTTNQE